MKSGTGETGFLWILLTVSGRVGIITGVVCGGACLFDYHGVGYD